MENAALTDRPVSRAVGFRTMSGMRSKRRERSLARTFLVPIAWFLVAFDIMVLLWILLSSFKSTREFSLRPWSLPSHWLWSNFKEAWVSANFGAGVLNSLVLVFGSGFGILLIAAPAAYALARFRARSANAHTVLFVAGMAVPAQTMFIPVYVMFNDLGLVDSIGGLMLIYIGTGVPFTVFLLTSFFRALPIELEEAAALDGASPTYTFWRIMLPLARSGLITMFLLHSISCWGETFFALVMLQTKTTLSLSLLRFSQTLQYTGARYSVLFAGLVIIIAPLLILYIFVGRQIIEGIAAGYSK